MVGHLHLQGMEDSPKERGREGLLDSPDSGLPPSPGPGPGPDSGLPPGPPFYSLEPGLLDARAGGASSEPLAPGAGEARAPPPLSPNPPALEMRPRLLPVFFGEGIEVNPEPAHEIRCNSEVKYTSEKHFRDNVVYGHVPTVTAYSETIVAAPNCTWRSYRSQLTLEPRPRALRFGCTTIIFPKRARRSFRTTLHCSLGRARRRFTASVQLQPGAPPPPAPPPAPRPPRALRALAPRGSPGRRGRAPASRSGPAHAVVASRLLAPEAQAAQGGGGRAPGGGRPRGRTRKSLRWGTCRSTPRRPPSPAQGWPGS